MKRQVCFAMLAFASAQAAGLAEDRVADFRSGNGPDAAWRALGADADRVMRAERGGLRIKLDGRREKLEPVGVSPQFSISGDFEVSLAYAILAAEKPTKGYGVGVNIFLQLNTKPVHTAKIAHYLRLGEGNVLYWDYKIGGAKSAEAKSVATEGKKGRLALKRTGATLVFLAGSTADDLKELGRIEIGSEDVQTVRIVANTGGSTASLDVRFEEIKVWAAELRNAPQAVAGGSGWIIWLGLVAAGLLAAVAAALWWWRRRAV